MSWTLQLGSDNVLHSDRCCEAGILRSAEYDIWHWSWVHTTSVHGLYVPTPTNMCWQFTHQLENFLQHRPVVVYTAH